MKKFLDLIFSRRDSANDETETASPDSIPPTKEPNTSVRLNQLFVSLLSEHGRIEDALNMLKSGHIVDKYAVRTIFERVVARNLNYKSAPEEYKSVYSDFLVLTFESMQKGSAKGEVYDKQTERHILDSSHYLMYLLEILANPIDLNTLSIDEKLNHVNVHKRYVSHFYSRPERIEPFYTKGQNYIAHIESSIAQELSSINLDIQNQNLAFSSALKMENLLKMQSLGSTALVEQCNLLNQRVANLARTHELSAEDKVWLNNLSTNDIPKLLTSSATTPLEIAKKYEEVSGQKFSSSLEELAKNYADLVLSLEEKYTLASAQNIHNSMQASSLYLDKKRQALGIEPQSSNSSGVDALTNSGQIAHKTLKHSA